MLIPNLKKTAIFILTYKMKKWFPDDTQSLVNETLKLTVTENDIKNKKLS
jgi:hypothetical protein